MFPAQIKWKALRNQTPSSPSSSRCSSMVFVHIFLAFALLVSGLSNALSILNQPKEVWASTGHPPPGMRVDFRLVLRRADSHLVSNDISDSTMNFMDNMDRPDGVDGAMVQTLARIRPLEHWLAEQGIEEDAITFSPRRNWISVNAPINLAERLFQTKYYMWTHLESGDTVVRPLRYSIPEAFHEQVQSIQPPARFT